MRSIAILGSTGSIGTQALDVIARHPDRFKVEALAANTSSEKLFEQVRRFHPAVAALRHEPAVLPADVRKGTEWIFGEDILTRIPAETKAKSVLVSVVGIAGLSAVMTAIAHDKRVLLANKEPLVAGGELVTKAAQSACVPLLPVDSEHSAIFQCLQGAGPNRPVRLLLTASGGPFRTAGIQEIENATKEQALRHPNWNMGRKITIDSATMINKALEVIEARWLFDMPPEKIDVVVHPQSVIHSMVEYEDGVRMADIALLNVDRSLEMATQLDFSALADLRFEKPDLIRFPGLRLGYDALRTGGTMTAILNGANEIAVAAFLEDRIRFGGIARLVEDTMQRVSPEMHPDLDAVFEADRKAREIAQQLLSTGRY